MITLREAIKEAKSAKRAIGHFNISDSVGFWAVVRGAQKTGLPVIIGVSEGERDFIGLKALRALVDSVNQDSAVPIFLNADHTYSFERAKEVIDAGYDGIVFDGSKLSLAENIEATKKVVDYARTNRKEMVIEGELGYIGQSSKLLDKLPDGVAVGENSLTTIEEAKQLVEAAEVDLLAPAVGNIHGMLKNMPNPRLNIARIADLSQAIPAPLVLHGGSGLPDEDFVSAIQNGVTIIHINTELRVAYRQAINQALEAFPEEIAPYRFLLPASEAMEKIIFNRLNLFAGKI